MQFCTIFFIPTYLLIVLLPSEGLKFARMRMGYNSESEIPNGVKRFEIRVRENLYKKTGKYGTLKNIKLKISGEQKLLPCWLPL